MASFVRRLALLSFQSTSTLIRKPPLLARSIKHQLPVAFIGLAAISTSVARSQTPSSQIMMSSSSAADIETGYLNAKDAYELDQQLFSTGYTLEQLMELAGLAVAEAVYEAIPLGSSKRRILIICGPGNNGGDGLVAARHLTLFGYEVCIVYPKRSSREPHYAKLVTQCTDVGVEILDTFPTEINDNSYDAVVDAIFGFSFKGEPREPFASIIKSMIRMQQEANVKIISVDVPSGWDVDEGDVAKMGLIPDVLVSLTAPKLCAKDFQGRHFVGGRFLPPAVAEKYGIKMPPYPRTAQVMEVNKGTRTGPRTATSEESSNDDWRTQYADYCTENEKERTANKKTNTEDVDIEAEDWTIQYQNHCIEKEAKLSQEEASKKAVVSKDEEVWERGYAEHLAEKSKEEQQ